MGAGATRGRPARISCGIFILGRGLVLARFLCHKDTVRFFIVLLLCTSALFAADAPRVTALKQELGLQFLDGESGFFAVIGQSDQSVTIDGRELPAQSQIYYLLTADAPINYLHWLASADTHILLEGGPVDYFIFHPDGRAECITLGTDTAAGQTRVIPVPANCRKALRLHPGATHALMANCLSPAWTPDRVIIGAGAAFLATYRNAAPWATEATLRELIGPNFREDG